MLLLKRIAYLVTRYKHDCSITLERYPQKMMVAGEVYVVCPICKKRYTIQFAGMVRTLIRKELRNMLSGKKKGKPISTKMPPEVPSNPNAKPSVESAKKEPPKEGKTGENSKSV